MATETVTWVTPVAQPPPGQPDINYAPNYDKWQTRKNRRLAQGGLETKVPDDFPEQLDGQLVWDGKTLAETYDWTYVLNEEQLAEIEQAVAHFKGIFTKYILLEKLLKAKTQPFDCHSVT